MDGIFLSRFPFGGSQGTTVLAQLGEDPDEYPLLMDLDRQLASFLESKLPPWPEPQLAYWDRDSRWEDPHAPHHFCKIARPNYPPAPPIAINQLWWPTGASRFAQGLFVAEKAVADDILKGSDSSDGQVQAWRLRIQYNGVKIEPVVYILAPRPVVEHKDGAELFLLPIVDERYWWQWRFYDCRNSTATDWNELLEEVHTEMTNDFPEDHAIDFGGEVIDTDYLKPDFDRLKRYGRLPIAALFDALVWSIGRRVVVAPQSNADIQLFTGAEWFGIRDPTTPLESEENIIAGGSHSLHPLPRRVILQAPMSVAHVREAADYQINADVKWWNSYTAASWFSGAGANNRSPELGSRYSVMTSACAFKATRATATPANETALQALADLFGEDWFAHVRRQFDVTFLGLRDLELTGFHDGLIFNLGGEHPVPSYALGSDESLVCTWRRDFYTRERSLPPSCLIQHQLSFDDSDWVTSQLRYEATNNTAIIAMDESGLVTLRINKVLSAKTVTAFYDWITVAASIPQDTELIVEYFPDRGEWVVVDHGCITP